LKTPPKSLKNWWKNVSEINWLKFWQKTGKKASEKIMRYYSEGSGSKRVGAGAGGDQTMQMDAESEKIVLKELEKLGVPLLVITEESGEVTLGKKEPEWVIVLDPLDGSENARMHLPFFAFSAAVLKNRDLSSTEFGFVLNLVDGTEYHAYKGKGAFKNGKKIKTSQKDFLDFMLMDIWRSHTPEELEFLKENIAKAKHTRFPGALALEMCFLAEGFFEALIRTGQARILDIAAAKIIVQEAGGTVTDYQGKKVNARATIDSKIEMLVFANEKIKRKLIK
jgi:myo-inositol-1(or 4)-monophosphatase